MTRVPKGSGWFQYPKIFAGAGLVCLLAAFFIGRSGDPARFYFSYLTAYMYGLSIALGGLFFVILQFVVRAGWSVVVRRVAENVMGTLPLFALLFIPVAFGLPMTHHQWWHVAAGTDPVLDSKAGFLNPPFFFIRAAGYLLIWCLLAFTFRKRSVAQDSSGDAEITYGLQSFSPPALILFAVTITFAAVDWMKSMEPHFFSTIWGVYYFTGSVVAIIASLIVLTRWLQASGFIGGMVNVEHFHDLGKLLFGFVVFWAYIAFSQYFLIWYANLPEETFWFAQRAQGGWAGVGKVLVFGHFFIPFFFLLPRGIKRSRPALLLAAVWMLVLHYVDLYFLIMPVHDPRGPAPGTVDLLTLLGVVGLFAGVFASLTASAELVPVKDPRLPESLAFENS